MNASHQRPTAGRTRFTLWQLIGFAFFLSVSFAMFAQMERRAADLPAMFGGCCALGAAIGVFRNRCGKGAALGALGFVLGLCFAGAGLFWAFCGAYVPFLIVLLVVVPRTVNAERGDEPHSMVSGRPGREGRKS